MQPEPEALQQVIKDVPPDVRYWTPFEEAFLRDVVGDISEASKGRVFIPPGEPPMSGG